MPPKRRSLALFGPSYPFRGGLAHYTTLLARALRADFDSRFFSYRRQYVQALFPGRTDRDNSEVPIEAEHAEPILDTLAPWTWVRAGRIAAELEVVLLPWWVVFWAPYYLLLLGVLPRRVKVVFLCHNVVEHEANLAKRVISRLVLRRGDGFVTHSRQEHDRLRQLIGAGPPIRISPHPLYDVFDRGRYDRASARAHLGLDPGGYVVLFFGFIRAYKGLDVLLEAFAALARDHASAHLIVVGESWQKDQDLPGQISALGIEARTTLVDEYVPNEAVEPYFKAADVVALPYRSGTGSGIVPIAFSMDRPVVATEIGAFTDVVDHGQTGLLVAPGSAAELEAALRELADPARRRIMEGEIARTKSRFEWHHMSTTIAELVEEILRR